jgi:hypothetical protein
MKDVPADPRSATIQHLRDAAAGHVANTSLRNVAREVGMSPTGLKKFLEGTAPYAFTVRRLRSWYVRHHAAQPSPVGMEDAGAALGVLVHDLHPTPRKQAALSVLEAVGRGYEESGKTRPAWVAELRTRYEAA